MLKHIPNILTFGRIALTIVFLLMLFFIPQSYEQIPRPTFPSYLDIAFILFVITGLTDIVDGKIARHYNVTSKLGRIMDPLADKILVCGAFICFAIIHKPTIFDLSQQWLSIIHWSVVVIIIAREITVTILRQIAETRGIAFGATASGKLKMFLQAFAIGTVIIKTAHVTRIWGDYFVVVTYSLMIAATIVSGIRATQRKTSK